ncbi:LOW QUALITY PROTEIN: mid1-interacting protein 1A-like [Acanthochromis polyacanthus]|uniref:LOW QUALITY PROTEIN: mid1-interacting protein 1A-like n=1 Tax=Acanthochromis polyacanthus TaxID=80966 RepID=UPI0022344958|nr:LOW QUALITY PROTEIN: mid1-interacting protein 1A-like [Acanthochromis polyacanthus]
MMMQLPESSNQKNNLFNAMNRFIGAVNNMDQTVMVPSLLRDVPVDEDSEMSSLKSDVDDGANHVRAYYQLLKSHPPGNHRWGVRVRPRPTRGGKEKHDESPDHHSSGVHVVFLSSPVIRGRRRQEDRGSGEAQFQYHLTGLQGVLSKPSRQQGPNASPNRYKKEVGIGGWGQ